MQANRQPIGPNSMIGERYRVVRVLGSGGMAYVFLAEDIQTGQLVALKVMRDDLDNTDTEYIRRFATEARAAASLDHPNIVRVIDYGQDGDTRYIVQEYVDGMTLKELIAERKGLNWKLAVLLMIQIASALEHAHQRGVIHRDIKPQNVLITKDMVAKVTDFGIARTNNSAITLTGSFAFGSVHYFSPEQAKGTAVTERSDLYSLGILLYEMVTGRVPFEGENSVTVAIKQLQDMPPRPSYFVRDLPTALDSIVFKAVQKNPELRYTSAREFINELEAFLKNPHGRFGVVIPGDNAWQNATSAITVGKPTDYSQLREIDKRIKNSKHSRTRDTLLMLAIVGVVLVCLVMFLLWIRSSFSPLIKPLTDTSSTLSAERTVELPDFTGKNAKDVMDQLEKTYRLIPNKDYKIEWETNDVVVNNIFEQKPEPGSKFVIGKDVLTLKASLGPKASEVPNVVGEDKDIAIAKIQEAGFSVLVQYERSDSVPANKVTKTAPEAGSKLVDNDEVTLYVSLGANANEQGQVYVPNLIGKDWQSAKEQAEAEGLSLQAGADVGGSGIDPHQAYVIKQTPAAGSVVVGGSTIVVDYGTAQDFHNAQNPTKQTTGGKLTMPDFRGQKWTDVYATVSSWQGWPAEASLQVTYASDQTPTTSEAPDQLYVMEQSVAPGKDFDPSSMQLSFTLGTKAELNGN